MIFAGFPGRKPADQPSWTELAGRSEILAAATDRQKHDVQKNGAVLREGARVKYHAEVDGGRSIEGTMSWSASTACTGRFRARIDPGGRPSFLSFEGECGATPTVFRQAMAYDVALTIEPPE